MVLPVGARPNWDDRDGDGEGEWEICNDNGFVYKRRRRRRDDDVADLRPPPTPSTSRDREAAARRARKKEALLSLRDKYRDELRQWELLSASLTQLSSVPAAAELPPCAAPSPSSLPGSAEIDELLRQAEAGEAVLGKMTELCEYAEAVVDAEEQRRTEALLDLPVWGSPRRLVEALTSTNSRDGDL